MSPIEATAMLSEMGAEAVKGHHKTGYVEGILDKDGLTVEGDDSSATTQDQDERIIAHPNLKIGYGLVRDEHGLVGKYVVGGPSIRDYKALG